MKVKCLTLKSFRGFGDITIKFNPNSPAVFIGVNGVGKSSILDALAILLSRYISLIQGSQKGGRLFTVHDIKNGNKLTQNSITVLDNSQKVTWSLTKTRTKQTKETQSNLQELHKLVEGVRHKLYKDQNPELQDLLIIVHYNTNRAVLDIPLRIRTKHSFKPQDVYEKSLVGGAIDFRIFFEWFRTQEDIENELKLEKDPIIREILTQAKNEGKQSELSKLFESLIKTENELSSERVSDFLKQLETRTYQDTQLQAVRQAIESLTGFTNLRVRRSPLRMTLNKNGKELIVDQLSDGEKCLLAMVGDLARRLAIANPSLEQPLEGEGIVLIDEIELHLHPKWQREIIPKLTQTFPHCQFIVTTHSPQVISHVQPENVYILNSKNDDIIIQHPESSYGRDSNQILEDIMGTSERPQIIKDKILELFRIIDQGNLEQAKELQEEIINEIGNDEPELIKAATSIKRKEILRR